MKSQNYFQCYLYKIFQNNNKIIKLDKRFHKISYKGMSNSSSVFKRKILKFIKERLTKKVYCFQNFSRQDYLHL